MRSRDPREPVDVRLARLGADERSHAEALLRESGLPTADLDGPDVLLFRGVIGGLTVGVGGLELLEEAVLLRSIAVAEDVRGRGYGTGICHALEREARRRGGKRAFLLTTDAAGFFERIGFDRCQRETVPPAVRRTRQFADLCPSSAVCMSKDLEDG